MDETAARLAQAREAASDSALNQESLADLFASFLVETGAMFNAWADAAHRAGPQEHDVYKCALALVCLHLRLQVAKGTLGLPERQLT